MYITEGHGNRSVRTAPLDQHRRLLIVTGESFAVGSADVALRRDRLAAWAQEHFPLESLTYGWATQDNTTADRVPYVGPFHLGSVRTYVATGFGGWGMTNGVMAAKLLAAEISDQERPEWAKLYDPRRLHPTVEAAALIKAQFEVGKHFVGDRLKPRTVGGIAELPSGRGALIRVGGERNAVYRDHDGLLHAVSSRCTHLGCLVAFNDAEASWDCPCHGSRFSIDGSVLQGPATKPLQRRTLPED
jgi:Rieske Fe-S protein